MSVCGWCTRGGTQTITYTNFVLLSCPVLTELSVVSLFRSAVMLYCVTSTEGCLFARRSSKIKDRWKVRPSANALIFNAGPGFSFIKMLLCYELHYKECLLNQWLTERSQIVLQLTCPLGGKNNSNCKLQEQTSSLCEYMWQRRVGYSRQQHEEKKMMHSCPEEGECYQWLDVVTQSSSLLKVSKVYLIQHFSQSSVTKPPQSQSRCRS